MNIGHRKWREFKFQLNEQHKQCWQCDFQKVTVWQKTKTQCYSFLFILWIYIKGKINRFFVILMVQSKLAVRVAASLVFCCFHLFLFVVCLLTNSLLCSFTCSSVIETFNCRHIDIDIVLHSLMSTDLGYSYIWTPRNDWCDP